MRLHHYTNAWTQIDADGVILANWRVPLVHLSTSDDPAGLPVGLRNNRYRITIEVPARDVHEWTTWAYAHLDPGEARTLTTARLPAIPTADEPPPGRPEEWVIVGRDIPRAEWLWAADLHERRLVWSNPQPPRT